MNGGGDVMLAYGLNKNLKKLKAGAASRPKSAGKPLKKKSHYIPQQEMMHAQY